MTSSDIDEQPVQLAVRSALEQYGHYFETLDLRDQDRAEQLGRAGRAAAERLGVEVSMAARPRRDADGVQVCLTVIRAFD